MVEGNNLLGALRAREVSLLEPHLTLVELERDAVLYEPGDIVHSAYFPRAGAVAGFTVLVSEGLAVETLMVGREGAVGGIVSHGQLPAYARCAVLHEGGFYRLALARLDELGEQSARFRHLFARYADCMMAQVFQSVACNATHTIEQRAARWLCATAERTGAPYIVMTQERIASMMGIGRSYASRVLQRMKAAGLLVTRRGGIEITDLPGLQGRACSCNTMVNNHFANVLAGVYPDSA